MYLKTLGDTSTQISAIGQGAGGHDDLNEKQRIEVLRYGIEMGMTLIDTAEDYGDGLSEEIVGKAIAGQRENVFVATKFSPEHNRYNDVIRALEGSLRRLNTDYVDLYQIHWPNSAVPLGETIDALVTLKNLGKVIHVGVCNFSLANLMEAQMVFDGRIVSEQVEYNLFDRYIENDVMPYCEENGMFIMAYNPLYRRNALMENTLNEFAAKYDKTPAQIILNWLVSHPPVVPLVGGVTIQHIKENATAADFTIGEEDLAILDQIHKPKVVEVPTDRIRVIVTDSKVLYTTMEDALENTMNLEPSVPELASDILKNGILKPPRLVPTAVPDGKYDYDLIRGKMRFWAWIMAYGPDVPIPAYIGE